MSRPVLPYGFEAYSTPIQNRTIEGTPVRDEISVALLGRWTVVSEVDWYQVRLDLNSLGMSSEAWLELLLQGHSWIDRGSSMITLRMWPVIGQRNGNLFVGLGSKRRFAGGEPIEGTGRRVA